jgi:hypothetical protein
MTLLKQMQRDCPQAIRDTLTLPTGQIIPIVGSVGADGSNDIDPDFWELIRRETK